MIQKPYEGHNPYFNRWFSAITHIPNNRFWREVTILILIDGFLQFESHCGYGKGCFCHNPYFNRWFSAIQLIFFC